MDAEIKAKWVKALRSGEYEQGQAVLRSLDNKFCCLGVLADMSPNVTWESTNHDGAFLCNGGTYAWLPREVRRWSGLEETYSNQLASLNDVGRTFPEIADYIEQNIPAE